jgi:vitamin B12 transporter
MTLRNPQQPSAQLCFTRWKNTSWAAFCTLKREVKIGFVNTLLKNVQSTHKASKVPVTTAFVIQKADWEHDEFSEESNNTYSEQEHIPKLACSNSTIASDATGQPDKTVKPRHAPAYNGHYCRLRFRQIVRCMPASSHLPILKIVFVSMVLNLLFTKNVLPQADSVIVMDELVISSNRIAIPFAESSRNIHIIQKEDIRVAPAQSIPEVLSWAPGVDVRQRGPAGVQSDISIRGGTFEQTLVLVNGIKLSDPQTGHHSMSIPVPLDHIERIEVLKGPGARIYGQNAFAGAVNFITGTSERRKIGTRWYGGSFGSFGGHASLSLPLKQSRTYLSVSGDRADGHRHNTDYRVLNGFFQFDYELPTGELNLLLAASSRLFGANGFYASTDFTEQYEEVRTQIGSLGYQTNIGSIHLKPRLYWRQNRDKYQLNRTNPSLYENDHTTNVFGAELNASQDNQLGTTGIGIEYRKELISGDWVRGGNNSESALNGFSRDNFGLFLDQRIRLATRLDLTPGVYVNWYSDFGWNAFPGMDIGYTFTDQLRIYANLGRSYRIPTFYDQYYESPVEKGSPDLLPEDAITYEMGLRHFKNRLSIEGNIFYRKGRQLIDWVLDPADNIWNAQNFQKADAKGFEIVVDYQPSAKNDEGIQVRRVGFSYNFLTQDLFKSGEIVSRYALEHVRHQIVASLDVTVAGKVQNSLRMRYIDRIEQNPYLIFDNRLQFEAGEHISIFVVATNLSNETYTEVMTPMPGLWVRGGLSMDIGF